MGRQVPARQAPEERAGLEWNDHDWPPSTSSGRTCGTATVSSTIREGRVSDASSPMRMLSAPATSHPPTRAPTYAAGRCEPLSRYSRGRSWSSTRARATWCVPDRGRLDLHPLTRRQKKDTPRQTRFLPTALTTLIGPRARFRRAPHRSTPLLVRIILSSKPTPGLCPELRPEGWPVVRRRVFRHRNGYGLTASSGSADEHAARQLFEPLLPGALLQPLPTQRRTTLLGRGCTPVRSRRMRPPGGPARQDRAGSEILANLAVRPTRALGDWATSPAPVPQQPGLTGALLYGCHENYLLHRRRDFRQVADALVAFS